MQVATLAFGEGAQAWLVSFNFNPTTPRAVPDLTDAGVEVVDSFLRELFNGMRAVPFDDDAENRSVRVVRIERVNPTKARIYCHDEAKEQPFFRVDSCHVRAFAEAGDVHGIASVVQKLGRQVANALRARSSSPDRVIKLDDVLT